MEISSALAAELATLTKALDDPGVDVAQTVQDLAKAAAAAVPSFLGLSLLIDIDGRSVCLTAFEESAQHSDAQTSLSTPLPLGDRPPTAGDAFPAIILVLYAAAPGAFVDLAADLSWLSSEAPVGTIKLDGHLAEPLTESTLSLRDLSVINQAIGALIGRGNTPEQAERYLHLSCARDGVDLVQAAAAVLAAPDAPHTDTTPGV